MCMILSYRLDSLPFEFFSQLDIKQNWWLNLFLFQVSPLNDIDKILDCEMRPTGVDENEASKLGSNQKYVKQYLVKWKGLSYLHCTW